MKLYGYWRSGAAWRVRIALSIKGVAFDQVSVNLARGAEQHQPAYRAINPQGRIPTLVLDDGTALIQSPAILEWIEETWPAPPLLPKDPLTRARVSAIASIIGCDVHPLTNAAGTIPYLRKHLEADDADVTAWLTHWNRSGFAAIEQLLGGGPFAFGDAPTLADLYIVPQVSAARRFKVAVDDFPKIARAVDSCSKLDAFQRAAPDAQPDKDP